MGIQDPYNGRLTLTVRTLQGRSVMVRTWGYRSVFQFKSVLSRLWGLDAEDMHLVYREQVMSNDRTLGYYMTQDATVILVPRLNSGFF